MKRIITVLAAMAIMAAVVAASAMPAFAAQPYYWCTAPDGGLAGTGPKNVKYFEKNGYTCVKVPR